MRAFNYLGKDTEKVFVKTLEWVARFENSVPMLFDEGVKRLYNQQHTCYACKEEFSDGHKMGHKVRDHCHDRGKFRGALHNVCNLKLRKTRTIPVLFNNLTGCDSHLCERVG